MLINRKNYELFFLDYLEGRLNGEEEAGLMAFLAQNPDLKEELSRFENLNISSEPVSFKEKEKLKKNLSNLDEITEYNFEQYCIAKMEGDLNEDMNRRFEEFLAKHPERLKDYKLLLQTFLEPDKNIVFAEKQKLRHRQIAPSKNRLLAIISVAASIAMIIVSYQIYNNYWQQDTKIYTAIHQKLKIDSLLTANILGPAPERKIEVEESTPKKERVAQVEVKDTTAKQITFKPKKPIEIVELDNRNELAVNTPIIPIPLMPVVALESKQSYLTVKEYASQELKKRLELENVDFEKEMTFWRAAQTGVKQINKLTGMNIAMDKKYDSTSNRTKVIIHTNLMSFYTSTKK